MLKLSGNGLLNYALAFTLLSPNLAVAGEGPGGSGGGNVLNDALASADEIKAVIENAKPRLMLMFKAAQKSPEQFGQKYRFAYLKMFKDDPDFPRAGNPDEMENSQLVVKFPIYREVQAADFALEAVKPCYDQSGTERDAAVISVSQHRICISLARLAKTVTLPQLYDKIYGLLAHEISHLTGTTETEAVFVQQLVSRHFGEQAKPVTMADAADELLTATEYWKRGLLAIFDRRTSEAYPFTQACVALGELNGRLEVAWAAYSKLIKVSGTQVFTVAEQHAFITSFNKTYMLKQFCIEESASPKSYWNRYIFKGGKSAPAKEFARWLYMDISTFRGIDLIGSGSVNYIAYQDRKQIESDTAEIATGLELVIRKLMNARWMR